MILNGHQQKQNLKNKKKEDMVIIEHHRYHHNIKNKKEEDIKILFDHHYHDNIQNGMYVDEMAGVEILDLHKIE